MIAFSVDAIKSAKNIARQTERKTIEVLDDQSKLSSVEFLNALGLSFHYPLIEAKQLHAMEVDFSALHYAIAVKKQCVPLRDVEHSLVVVIADPFMDNLHAWLQEEVKEAFTIKLAHYTDVAAFLSQQEDKLKAMDRIQANDASIQNDKFTGIELSLASISEDASPVIKVVNSTLYDAMKAGASDVHLESTHLGLSIKYRIDGVLDAIANVAGVDVAEQIISRIKVIAELDISEQRIPQDGRFKVLMQQREIDFRVSIMPSVFGEDAVIRILDRKTLTDQSKTLILEHIGLDEKIRSQFRRLCKEPYGMVLVTGPTGSGKTTTLYAAISEVHTGKDKIITIEDPVEYNLNGILQIPVNEKKGLSFSRGLRSILRHDPDKIMVGEIRDTDTAQIAVQAALTGHLVFTTVHANNVFDVIGRFLNMGLDTYSFVSSLNCILAQRLVRLICPNCATPEFPSHTELEESNLSTEQIQHMQFMKGQGCGQCRGTGYKGRMAVAELLVLDDEIRECIVTHEPIRKLKELAQAKGFITLRSAAIMAVAAGKTTLEEINRVTFIGR
jgi:general secretion pathway protein E